MGLRAFLFSRNSKFSFKASELLKKVGHAVTFDDILLEPQFSKIVSRKDVDISSEFLGKELKIPIISANMDTVTNLGMVKAMQELGATGILHRYQTMEEVDVQVNEISSSGGQAIPSIGVQDGQYEMALRWTKCGAAAVCLDIAHADTPRAIELTKWLSKEKVKVIVGNVSTYDGVLRLADAGAYAVKVGQGSGSHCTTRIVTGHGVPQISALLEAVAVKRHFPNLKIIADGGIRNSGDIVKSLAMGADYVMLGSLLAGSLEAPGDIINGYKAYRGMASRESRLDFDPNMSLDYTPEGVASMRPVTGPVKHTVNILAGGVRSGLSYSGSKNLKEFRKKVRFMVVSSSSQIENTPHGLKG